MSNDTSTMKITTAPIFLFSLARVATDISTMVRLRSLLYSCSKLNLKANKPRNICKHKPSVIHSANSITDSHLFQLPHTLIIHVQTIRLIVIHLWYGSSSDLISPPSQLPDTAALSSSITAALAAVCSASVAWCT